jgi:spore maturation protein SpmB
LLKNDWYVIISFVQEVIMVTADTFKRGLKNGINTLIELSKFLIPVYIVVKILSVSGLLNILAEFFKPVMSVLGLPGEASLVIMLGYFLGIYAALGALAAIDLTSVQITTVAIMLSIAHNLITETALVKKLGVSAGASIAVRVSFSILMGFLYYRIFG